MVFKKLKTFVSVKISSALKLSEYKESGILYAYVLGVLDPERTEQLHEDLETNIALRKELNEVEQSLSNFKANFTKQGSSKSAGDEKRITTRKTIRKSQKGQRLVFVILIVLVVGLVFLFLSTLYERASYQSQLMESREIIIKERLAIDSLSAEIATFKHSLSNRIEGNDLEITLSGSSAHSNVRASIFPDRNNSRILIYLNQIPDIQEKEFIQLWGKSGSEWRRTGLISYEDLKKTNGFGFFTLPLGSSVPEMATLETNPNTREPDMSRVLFR